MKEAIIKTWATEVRKFAKDNPSFLHLRFPMKMQTTQGDAYSPFGILCKLHSKETGKEWTSAEVAEDSKKLKSNLTYLGAYNTPPVEVQKWLDVPESFWSCLFGLDDFEAVANRIEALNE
jgi:hypothetical protein